MSKHYLTPYEDHLGFCTIGVGHLIDGKQRCAALKNSGNAQYKKYEGGITIEQDDAVFAKDVKRIVNSTLPSIHVPLHQHEFDALMSLAFNTGGLTKFKKLLGNLNTKNYTGCCDEFADITNGGGKELKQRRKSEMKLFRNMFMMRSIETIIARCVPALGFACLALASCWASAATHEGTWKFERSMDYYGRTPANAAPPFPHLVVRAQEVSMSANCVAKFSMEDYAFSDVFQPLTREGGTAKQLDGFLAKNFGLTLGKVTTVYSITSSQGNCARPVMEFFQVGDRLLMPIGVTFYSYVKDETTKPASSASAETGNMVLSKGYKITPLPLDFNK